MTETTTMTTTEVDTDPLFTADETADYLRVHPNTALKLLRASAIPAAKVGRQWRVRRSDLDAFMCKPRPRAEVLGKLNSDPTKNYILIAGPSGSGKSELARELRERYPDAWIEEVQPGPLNGEFEFH